MTPDAEIVPTIVPEDEAAPEASPFAPMPPWRAAAQDVAPSVHWALMLTAAAVIALAMLLSVRGESQVALPLVGGPLPELCGWKRFFGVSCPGCGLTRCFISLAHGDLPAAWHFNPAGILLFAGVAFQVPYRAAQLWRLRRGRPALRVPGVLALVWTAVALLLLQWLLKMAL